MGTTNFNNVWLTPPKDWEDRSTILWLEPAQYATTPEAIKTKLPRANFLVERLMLEGEKEPVDYLGSRMQQLSEDLPHFKLVSGVSAYQHRDFQGAEMTYSFETEQLPVQQRFVVVFVGDTAFHLVATATTSRFSSVQKTFQDLLESFRVSGVNPKG